MVTRCVVKTRTVSSAKMSKRKHLRTHNKHDTYVRPHNQNHQIGKITSLTITVTRAHLRAVIAEPLVLRLQASVLSHQTLILLSKIAFCRVEEIIPSEPLGEHCVPQSTPGVAQLIVRCINFRLRARPRRTERAIPLLLCIPGSLQLVLAVLAVPRSCCQHHTLSCQTPRRSRSVPTQPIRPTRGRTRT